MVLPIPAGTVLRQRYLVQEVLGQGGFGRTYLALDQERFNDRCVIKEFVVPYHDGGLIEKSKALFQREASILYQIQHPQIPRFWAAFEDEQRLFLVQDFVDGQTYRRILSDRKQHGQAFSEVEVRHLLAHLLPVLAHIHDRAIIHRDISPENVILQMQTVTKLEATYTSGLGLPILIDFGAVKEATSHWPLMSTPTRVGKVGYAPPEQLQTGKVYPNSDLYALAASCLVLLTGREPQTLLESQTLTWRWEAYAYTSEELSMILRKMLAVYPSDRYQSAREVQADLQTITDTAPKSTLLQPPAAKSVAPGRHVEAPSPSTIRSIQPPNQLASAQLSTLQSPQPLRTKRRSIDEIGRRPSKLQLGIAASLIAGLGAVSPVVWQTWTSQSESDGDVWVAGAKLPQSEAARIIDQGSNRTDAALKPFSAGSSVGSDNPSNLVGARSGQAQPIQFPSGKISTVVQGNLQGNNLQSYTLEAAQGQIMTASLEGTGVTMNLLRSSQDAINSAAYETRSWTGQLPADDQYLIQVAGSGPYSLEIAVTPLARPAQASTQRIAFALGQTGTTVTGQLASNQVRRYLLRAKQGQILAIDLLQGAVNWSAIAPNGQRVGGSATNAKNWQGRLSSDGDYVIEVTAKQAGDYVLSCEIF